METPLPTAEKLKSLNVEESRAKRLERQQARLRDRGGIFRPENRNTNLFDMLCQATHRRSPRKDRGRSRTRSVSPIKKNQTSNTFTKRTNLEGSSKIRTSPRKATNISSIAIRDVEPKGKSKEAGGKQKQKGAILEQAEDGEKTKAGPKTKKIATNTKKTVGGARQRTRKKSTSDELLEHEDADSKTSGYVTKPRGKRKKTSAEDVEVREDPPPKTKKSKSTKAQTNPRPDDGPVNEGSTNTLRAQNRPQALSRSKAKQGQGKQGNSNSRKKANPSKPPGGARVDVTDEAPDESQARPIESVGNQKPVLEDDVPRTKRRRAPPEEQSRPKHSTKSNSGTSGDKSKPEMSLYETEGDVANRALADAINKASRKRTIDTQDSVKPSRASKKPKREEHPLEPTAPPTETRKSIHSYNSTHETAGPTDGPKPKRKRTVGQTDIGNEMLPTEKVTKRTKIESTNRAQEVSNPEVLAAPAKPLPKKSAPSSKGGRKAKPRSTKTASRKQKENTVLVEPAAKGDTTIKVKGGTKIDIKMPARIEHKLKTVVHQVDYHSDDEPDPIDFLS